MSKKCCRYKRKGEKLWRTRDVGGYVCKTFSDVFVLFWVCCSGKKGEGRRGIRYGERWVRDHSNLVVELAVSDGKTGYFSRNGLSKKFKNNSVLYCVSGGGLWPHQISTFSLRVSGERVGRQRCRGR